MKHRFYSVVAPDLNGGERRSGQPVKHICVPTVAHLGS